MIMPTFLFLALLSEIVGTVGGFGSSVFFVPIANFYFNFNMVLGMTALFHVSSNISKIIQFRKGLDKQLTIYLGVPAVIMVITGGIISKYLETTYLEIFLGISLIIISLIFLIYKNLKIKAQKKQAIIGGSISGLMAGLLGTGGAIRGITMAAFNLEKSVFYINLCNYRLCCGFKQKHSLFFKWLYYKRNFNLYTFFNTN